MDIRIKNDTFPAKDWEEVEIEAREVDLNDEQFAVILVIWLTIEVFGNGMLIGLIVYEKEGNGDPLKRRITDQVKYYSGPNINSPDNLVFVTCVYIYIQRIHASQPIFKLFFKVFTSCHAFILLMNLIATNMLGMSCLDLGHCIVLKTVSIL